MSSEHTPPPRRAARAATAANPTRSRTEPANGSSEALALLSADDLAAAWGVRTKHVYTLARDGDLPCVRLGRYVRFRQAAVTAWLDEQEGGV
jgi:excisionase family DNA binding protein